MLVGLIIVGSLLVCLGLFIIAGARKVVELAEEPNRPVAVRAVAQSEEEAMCEYLHRKYSRY